MTMSAPQSAADFVSAVRLDSSLTLAAFSILYYDYALTITSEIEYYWNPPSMSAPFVLFVVSRYLGLLGPLPVFFEYFGGFPEHRCRQLQFYHQIYAYLGQAMVGVLMILRTYALYNCSKRVLAVLIFIHICGGIQCFAAILTSHSSLSINTPLGFKFPGCNLSLTDEQVLIDFAIAWSALLWFDTTIFVLTLYKSIKIRHEIRGGLPETMFRDGTSSIVLSVAHTQLSLPRFAILCPNTPLKGTATTLTNVMSVTLVSRLMLNLRSPTARDRRRLGGSATVWTSGRFSSRVMTFMQPTLITDNILLDDFPSDSSESSGSSRTVATEVTKA
ncbi:hypothetical protein BD310DRAFT_911818 [Dichomitus squalens]|uniref:DUF6533 domain-containing protein n=1 Tax=Dichomitus squalens TaxID=114155 RepID=A0A4Q9QFM0_9APHY|nr:hypothetical protein BD310DRAFT_911818 [Dichomitus squalens]